MKIELTEGEVMWILDKVSKERKRGEELIEKHSDGVDGVLVQMTKKVVSALAELGIKLTNAMLSEIDKSEEEKKETCDETTE